MLMTLRIVRESRWFSWPIILIFSRSRYFLRLRSQRNSPFRWKFIWFTRFLYVKFICISDHGGSLMQPKTTSSRLSEEPGKS